MSVDCKCVLLQQGINKYSTNYLYVEVTSSKLTINFYQLKINSVMSTYGQEHDSNL